MVPSGATSPSPSRPARGRAGARCSAESTVTAVDRAALELAGRERDDGGTATQGRGEGAVLPLLKRGSRGVSVRGKWSGGEGVVGAGESEGEKGGEGEGGGEGVAEVGGGA